jgi:hypothetical protein
MKRSEIAKLVTVIWAAEGVNREPTEADVEIWYAFSREGRWESYDAALRAYVVYRSAHPSYRVNPGHITETLEEVRRASSQSFELAIERVPDHVRDAEDFDAAYMAWVKGEAAKHRTKGIDEFVAGKVPGQRAIEA